MVQRKTNPRTQITEVQKSFEAAFYHRLIRDDRDPPQHDPLAPAIREKVVDEDALGLETIQLRAADARLQFEFDENPRQAAEFEDWLNRKIRTDVLELGSRSDVVSGRHYTSEYIRQSSEQGVKHARRELRRAGVDLADEDVSIGGVLRTPVHRDIIESAYIRTYDELEGITSEMATDISRTMSDGLSQGWNPRRTASEMAGRVDDVGLTRSRRLARTETSRVYTQHAAARYDDHGVREVKILTHDPCDDCASLAADDPYPIEEAGSLIPARTHPSCVCTIAPVPESIAA